MGERAHCTKHNRYLQKDGTCTDCVKLDLVISYAKDIVENWSSMTMRTIGKMTSRVEDLKQALELLK